MQPYSWHVRHHSSEQLATIEKAQLVTLAVVLPLVQTVAASILGLFVLAALVWIAPFLTVAALVTLGGIYFAIGVFARKRLDFHSSRIDDALDRRIRIVQEGLGGIREVILDGAQDEVVDRFRAPDAQLARSRADAAFVTSVPRYLIESLGITIIAVLAYSLSQREGGLIAALPVLGALALGAQRLLPVMQQLYTGWTSFAANSAIVDDVVRRLSLPVPPAAPNIVPLRFEHGVEFRGVSFSYEDRTHHAVEDLNFVVPHAVGGDSARQTGGALVPRARQIVAIFLSNLVPLRLSETETVRDAATRLIDELAFHLFGGRFDGRRRSCRCGLRG